MTIGKIVLVHHQITRIYDDEVEIIMMQVIDLEKITRIDVDHVQSDFMYQVTVNYRNYKVC
jgi:hypothetical protein